MKPTDKNIAEHFGTTPQTLGNWKRSKKKELLRRYEAYKEYFINEHKATDEELQSIANYLQVPKSMLFGDIRPTINMKVKESTLPPLVSFSGVIDMDKKNTNL